MIDLKDLTILIALKVDSQDRLNNLDITMDYLQSNLNTNIVICEQDTTPKLKDRYNCKYIFKETNEFFNRQRGVNLAAKAADTPVVAHYDADILLTSNQIKKATEVILNGKATVVYPFDGNFYDVPKKYHNLIKEAKSTSVVDLNECTRFHTGSVGGAVFFNTDTFWKCGGANENFKGLGYEDNEIFFRFKKLGCEFARISGPLYHLNHVRLETSYNHNPHLESNRLELHRIGELSNEQLLKEIEGWSWK